MGRFFHKPSYSIYAKPPRFHSCFDYRTVISIDPNPRFQRCEVQEDISPDVTKSSSNLGKQLQSSSKMRFLHKRKAFKKKKTKKMLVNKRKATTT
ncbi:hypothetical protein ISN44_As11g000630 [Arabidopsis suecica]|uniref:Uncharacterized protein n=1 Tax=Arabidopsis suecica TaxID=45249 RepID=A0A8T1Z3V5_ARASU|nr:hypothetical protein ISN44_As11g000630 [Arabidopsis suecica]